VNLAALETFYWIVRLGTFHDAAAKLNVSQPAVSARIRELEASLGLALFDRVGRSVRLTPKGRKVFDHAQRIVGEVEDLLHHAASSPAISGIVRIGAGELLTGLWLPAMLTELQRRYPGLLFDIEVDVTVNLRRKLHQGEIDIAFLAGPIQGPDLKVSSLMPMPMCWAGAAPLISPGQRLTPEMLAALPVITLSRVSFLHGRTCDWFEARGVSPRRLHVCNSVALLVRIVALGFGVSMLPRMVIAPGSGIDEIRQDETLPPLDFVSAMHLRNHSRPAEIVGALAEEFARSQASPLEPG
jgi:DNA-binding transcriptional LysR family regulator